MTQQEQIRAFEDDLDNLVDRYRAEFDMTYASVVGVLAIKAHLMIKESAEDDE